MDLQSKDRETRKERGFVRHAAAMLWRVSVTTAILAGAVFAVQFGANVLAQRADANPTPEAAPAIPVASSPLLFEDSYDVSRAFIGQIEPRKTVAVSFELPGRLSEINVDEGDTVSAGQLLAVQDTALLGAERDQLLASKTSAQAQLKLAVQTVARSQELTNRGFATQARLDDALARRDDLTGRISEIDAAIENVDIRMDKAIVVAPFDGRVTTRSVDGGEPLGAGQVILGLVETGPAIARVGVPLDFNAELLSDAEVEIGGARFLATLVTLRPDVDPITRTRTAIFEIVGAEELAFGQTARLLVTQSVASQGTWVPLTSLKEGLRGQWTVLVVGPKSKVREAPVEILHAEAHRVFVRGAFPEGFLLIDEGPQRVAVGQLVATVDQD